MSVRVVVLTPYFRPIVGGVESNAERLARVLHARGFGVRVVTKRITDALPDTEILDGVPVERIGPRGERSASAKWLLVPFAFGWLRRHVADYDVVCVVDYRGVGVAAVAARAFTGRPVVLQGQTPGILAADPSVGGEPVVERALRWPVRAVYARADAVACISHVLEREALTYGLPPARVHFVPNPVDMMRFCPAGAETRARLRRERQWPADRPVCLFVGRLSREKGVLDLVAAWRLLQPIDALLAIAGPDMPGNAWDAGPAAREAVQRDGLQDSVQFLGPIADVVPLLQAADLAVQPSHFEAQGLSTVEALACGIPVVASAVGGLLDFVVDGVNGCLCPPHDPPALAAALRAVLTDHAQRARLAGRARALVADEYDEQTVFGRLAALLERLAERRA